MHINPFIQSHLVKDDLKKLTKKNGTSTFSLEDETRDKPGISEGLTNVSASQSTSALLGVQNLHAQLGQKAIRYSRSLLSNLRQLQCDLLEGKVSRDNLIDLEETMRNNRSYFNHPELDAVINDIEVRVAVELAKYPH